jgi:prepilin-type N-terminal cleavage/methylation domain-containing protein
LGHSTNDEKNLKSRPKAKKNFGFTLAEVLIVIGVIGVVAVLALPTLITGIQGKVRARQVQVIEHKFTQATTRMTIEGQMGPNFEDTEAFVKELSKYLKIVTVCKSDNLRSCWPYDKIILENGKEYDITKAKTGKAFKMDSDSTHDYTSQNVGIVTADGTPMIISFNTKCESFDPDKNYAWSGDGSTNATTGCIAAIFDVNGSTPPNRFRNDVIAFNANGLGSECAIEVGGKCFGALFTPTPLSLTECEAQKDALGIKDCSLDNDYWAGAVAQCGGVSNMPTDSDLAQLGSLLYNGNPTINVTQEIRGLSYTWGTATSLGLPEPYFYLWSGTELASWGAYGRFFDNTNTRSVSTARITTMFSAMCVAD